MSTIQDVANKARDSGLNDDDKTRYTDDSLGEWANAGIAHALTVRPDLRFGFYSVLNETELALTDTFPLPYRFLRVVADYVVGRAEAGDDQYATTGRAMAFMQLFEKEVATL